MRGRMRAVVATAGLAGASALAACADGTPPLAPPSPAALAAVRALAPHPCNGTTASVLDARGVDPGAVGRIFYDRRVTGSDRGILQGYDAWIGFRDRPGDLVVRHDPSCSLIASYTRGG